MSKSLEACDLRWHNLGPWSFRVESGEALGISGPSGAGKSVLLRVLADLLPHQGEARLDGVACSSMPAPIWRQEIRYCAAVSGWWADRVVEHFVDIDMAKVLAKRIGLTPDLFDKAPAQLSTGERQRMALLRSLENNPSFLLLDEPTSALDQATTAAIESLLAERIATGMGLVVVSHDGEQLQRMATNTIEIRR